MSKPKSQPGIQDSFVPESRRKERSKAMFRAILIAAAIEAPLMILAVFYMPVEVVDSSGQSHTVFSYTAIRKGSNRTKLEILLPELLAIGLIPISAIIFTLVRYR